MRTVNGVVLIDKSEDETICIHLGSAEVITVDHDEVGWAGMDAVERAVRALAEILGLPVEDA